MLVEIMVLLYEIVIAAGRPEHIHGGALRYLINWCGATTFLGSLLVFLGRSVTCACTFAGKILAFLSIFRLLFWFHVGPINVIL